MYFYIKINLYLILFCGLLLTGNIGVAKDILMQADQLEVNQVDQIVIATGHVQISYNQRLLQADRVIYYQKTDKVIATGNVYVTDQDQDNGFLYANYLELDENLKQGVIENFLLILKDGSRVAATRGDIDPDRLSHFDYAVYSACRPCQDNPKKPLVWQIKSVSVTRDGSTHRLIFKDAWLELFDIPVFYVPYFSIPDGTLKKQSGLLAPKIFSNRNTGFVLGLPVFINLDASKDVTLTPYISLKGTAVLDINYRQRFTSGYIDLDGSVGIGDYKETIGSIEHEYHNDFRGHLALKGGFDINNQWRLGMDVTIASDKSYLSDLSFNKDPMIASSIFTEGFLSNHSYFKGQGIGFYGTRDIDINQQQTFALPRLVHYYRSNPSFYNTYWDLRSELTALHRVDGRESQKLSIDAGLNWSSIDRIGSVWNGHLAVQSDLYHVQGVDPDSEVFNPNTNKFTGWQGRLTPRAFIEWRYPMVKSLSDASNISIEPILSITAAPSRKFSGKVPNEDGQDIILDPTNIFLANRLVGVDRPDRGSRITYGFQFRYDNYLKDWQIYLAIGNSYQFNKNLFPEGTGLSRNVTDLVGTFGVILSKQIDIGYQFQFDPNNKKFRRQEITLKGDFERFTLNASYISLQNYYVSTLQPSNYEWATAQLSMKLSPYWTIGVSTSFDAKNNKFYSYGGFLTYDDECFNFGVTFRRRTVQENSRKTDNFIGITFSLTNIGGINPGVNFK